MTMTTALSADQKPARRSGAVARMTKNRLKSAKSTLGSVASVVAGRVRHRPASAHGTSQSRFYDDLLPGGASDDPPPGGASDTPAFTKRAAAPPRPICPPSATKTVETTSWQQPETFPHSFDGVDGPTQRSAESPSSEEERSPHGFVLYDYVASQPDELSLKAGEVVRLIGRVNAEWTHGQSNGQSGIFPTEFVDVVLPLTPAGDTQTDAAASILPTENGPRCIALFDYESSEVGDLCFRQGEVIVLVEKQSDDWLRGELASKIGIFPTAFVRIVEDLPTMTTPVSPVANDTLTLESKEETQIVGELTEKKEEYDADRKVLGYCVALHGFSGERDDDLRFDAGDRIAVTAHLDADWLRGKVHGRDGIFPAAFVTIDTDDVNAESRGQSESPPAVPKPDREEPSDEKTDAADAKSVTALYGFVGDTDGDLSFAAGDVIGDVGAVDAEWLRGTLRGRTGIFPTKYVEDFQV